MGVKTVEYLMNKAHAIDSSVSKQMLDLLFQSKLVHNFVLDNGLVKLLICRRGTQNKP